MEPRAELLHLPKEYGTPTRVIPWADVRARLEDAMRFWLATARPDGRPHVVGLDGVWLDDAWYFGGSTETVWHKTLMANPEAVLHLEDALHAVIVEGRAMRETPDAETAARLAERAKRYGYGMTAADYQTEMWVFRPVRAFAWNEIPHDFTRFVFEGR